MAGRRRIAAEVLKSGADVVILQGVWTAATSEGPNVDFFNNKAHMAELLKGSYKYALAADRKNDGLLIVSKWVPFYFDSLTFGPRDVSGRDQKLQKGAIMAGFYNPEGGFVVVVDTHLQSGVDKDACIAREKQAKALGYWVHEREKADWRIQDSGRILAGDLGEPVTLQKDQGRIVDRTRYLAEQIANWFTKVDNDQAIAALCRSAGVQDVVQVEPVRQTAQVRKLGVGEPVATLRNGDPLVAPFRADGGWTYWKEATDASGCQIRTHFLLTPDRLKLLSLVSLRGPYLADQGASKPADPGRALARNAAVLAEIELVK